MRGFRLDDRDEVELTLDGVVENRRFLLVDGDGRRLRSSLTDWPVHIVGRYDPEAERLALRFPDGSAVDGSALELGATVVSDVGGQPVEGRVVDGPWTAPLSGLAGHPVRVVRPAEPGRCHSEPVTLVSDASLERLAEVVGAPVDARRFRMLFQVSGCPAHGEDTWQGRLLRIGEAVVRVRVPVDRCAVTTRHPETGERDLDTLAAIRSYRGLSENGTIDFGMRAGVDSAGVVRVGAPVELVS